MQFHSLPIEGAYLIECEPRGDERGEFSRLFCAREFEKEGLATTFVQANHSRSVMKGTLRGMHFQLNESAEEKLVRCTSGALFDVIIDLKTHQWYGAELTPQNHRMLYVPKGCAHGFITLKDNTDIHYLVSSFYDPKNERGVRWNDPQFSIEWPLSPSVLSQKDASYPDHKIECFI